ncbi:ribonuclease domain-containing protein [Streptomyces seoulensis]|uniref:ribonuclease domain-containing protein n=1 Tax=Streptomyces seoulensis TaxID=73044 RepID=UPI003C30B326
MLSRFVPQILRPQILKRSTGRSWLLAGVLAVLGVLLAGCAGTDTAADSPAASQKSGPAASAPAWAKGMATVPESGLPAEARRTLALIDKGGPYPYARDGIVFGNFEGHLPGHQRGYYHEYTVPTPSSSGRGARRIVTGDGGEFYYTDDHYNSFRAVLR